MSRVYLVSVCLVVLLAACGCDAFTARQLRRMEVLRHRAEAQKPLALPQALWFHNQTLDHFNAADTRQWSQRFYVNDTFFDPAVGGPIFLQAGGEGAISPGYVTDFQYVDYARENSALIVAVEHRFYGESLPLGDLSTDNLQYLSSMQAQEDLNRFTAWFKQEYAQKYGLGAGNPVVLFGCSYSGALVTWTRMRYPNTFTGAVAGSAPVQAKLDFKEYLQTVQVSLATKGSTECLESVRSATDSVQSMLTTAAGQAKVKALFKTCTTPTSSLDISTLMSNLAGNWMGVVQYNDEGVSASDIESLCATMTNATDPLAGYEAINDMFLKQENVSCMDISYDDMVKELQDVTPPAVGVGARAWTYQTCTEFGYYQTTSAPQTTQPFGSLVPVTYYTQMCADIFNTGVDVGAAVNATNVRYGGQHPSVDRVIWIDGTIDPWRPLTVLQSPNPASSPVITITGTAHCATSFPLNPHDPTGVAPAFQEVNQLLAKWVHNGN